MEEGSVSVKTYHMAGNEVTIEISLDGPDGFELVYKEKGNERKFSGGEVYQEEIKIGKIATVVLDYIPDLRTTTLSVVIPFANKSENIKSIPVKTFSVRTVSKTNIGGPQLVEGQIQNYEVNVLEGNAW